MAFSTINKGSLYQNNVIYTGDGSTQAITGVGFQPDFVWLKRRDTTGSNMLLDAVRGATKRFTTNGNDAEETQATGLTTFGADGFTLGGQVSYNGNTGTFASWNWKANGAGSSNTDGSVTSTVSANTTSGFSICTWTGTGSVLTVGHGLGAVPKFILVKRLNALGDGVVYHEAMGNGGGMEISSTGAYNAVSGWFNSTTPTSSVFTLGTNGNINTSGGTYVAYCFAEVDGFSKFNSYKGNGNVDGRFCFTGFRPSFLLIKITSGADSWRLWDNARNTYNTMDITLRPNTNDGDYTASANNIDFLSNGFKLRTISGGYNGASDTISYMAFGQPIISNSGICATAR